MNNQKQTVYLNTKFRARGNRYNSQWSLPSTLISNTQDEETLRLTIIDLIIPFDSYNIYSYDNNITPDFPTLSNNTFTFSLSVEIAGVPSTIPLQTVAVPTSNYNVFDLCEYLSTEMTNLALTAGGATYTGLSYVWSYNFNTMKYEMTVKFDGAAGNQYIVSSCIDCITFDDDVLTLARVLGMQINTSYCVGPITPTTVQASLDPSTYGQGNVGLPRQMNLKMDLISSNIGEESGNKGIGYTTTVSTIPLNVPNGSTLTYQNVNNDFVVDVPSHYLDQLQISITDENGIPILTYSDWALSFRIDYIKVDHSTERLLSQLIYLSQLQVMGQKEIVESTEPEYTENIKQ